MLANRFDFVLFLFLVVVTIVLHFNGLSAVLGWGRAAILCCLLLVDLYFVVRHVEGDRLFAAVGFGW